MTGSPEDNDDDLGLPAMDSETTRLLRYATTLHWDDPAYVLGCFQWNCAQDAYAVGEDDEAQPNAVMAARERSDELLNVWRDWMHRYPDLYAKRVARWTENDELPLGTRLTVRLQFLAAELKTIAEEVEYTDAFAVDEQRYAKAEVAMILEHVGTLLNWIRDRKDRINTADATADPDDPVQ